MRGLVGMLKAVAVLLMLALVPGLTVAGPGSGDELLQSLGIEGCTVEVAPIPLPPDSPLGAVPEPPQEACAGIRPGAKLSNGCTMNFVFTDGTDLYVGTAGHCTYVGHRLGATGVGRFGTTVYDAGSSLQGDFALIRVDADKHHLVNPTLCRFGGPSPVPPSPAPGGIYHIYGWGWETRGSDDSRARSGVELAPPAALLAWEGRVSGGDSGSPVISADGRAMGVATRMLRGPGAMIAGEPIQVGAAIGTALWYALDEAKAAGFDLQLVPGELPRLPEAADVPL